MAALRLTSLLIVLAPCSHAQRPCGPAKGVLVVDGGSGARIGVVPTGASSLRFGLGKTILDPDWPHSRPAWGAYEKHLREMFGVEAVADMQRRDRTVADSAEFTKPLLGATGVFSVLEIQVIGKGGVAVYDNQPRPAGWHNWLKPGDRVDLAPWRKLP